MALKKYSKVKFRFVSELAYILIAIVVMVTVAICIRIPSDKDRLTSSYTSLGATLAADHNYDSISANSLLKKIEQNDSGLIFVYYGSPKCEECKTNVDSFNTIAKSWDIEKIFYLRSDFATDTNREDNAKHNSKLLAMEERFNDSVADKISAINLDYTPSLWVFLDGELIFNSQTFMDEDTKTMQLTWEQIANRWASYNYEAQ